MLASSYMNVFFFFNKEGTFSGQPHIKDLENENRVVKVE